MISVKLPIYIEEFSYRGKVLKDVLILSRKQLKSILNNKVYGEVLYEYLKNHYQKENNENNEILKKEEQKGVITIEEREKTDLKEKNTNSVDIDDALEEYPLFRKKLS